MLLTCISAGWAGVSVLQCPHNHHLAWALIKLGTGVLAESVGLYAKAVPSKGPVFPCMDRNQPCCVLPLERADRCIG